MMSLDDKPLKLAVCTWATGIGGGVARMDAYLHRFLDRRLVEPVFIVTREQTPGETWFDDSVSFEFTGVEGRFEKLVGLFMDMDIVQFQGGFDPLVCEAARVSGVPVLVEVIHTIEPGGLYPYIDASVCVSETVKKVQPSPEKAVVINNGAGLGEFPFAAEQKSGDRIVILQAGSRAKSSFNLDEAAEEVLSIDPRIEIWLAGSGMTGQSADRVKFLGLRSDIAALYRQADIVFSFTRREAFGLVVVEAMASGAVPVVSRADGPGEIVTHGVDGYSAPPDDREGVISAIREAVRARGTPQWERIRRAAREKVEKNYSAGVCVKNYERLYAALVEKKGRRVKPGPKIKAAPTFDALIADGVFHLQNGRDGMFLEAMEKAAAAPGRVGIPLIASLSQKLAKHAAAKRRKDIAHAMYRKLYDTGYRDAFWMKDWLSVFPAGERVDFLVSELAAIAPRDPEVVMLAAENFINAGDLKSALGVLDEGIKRIPESGEIRDILGALRSRLGAGGVGG